MFLLYADETNLDARAGDFFVYGGISIPSESAGSLHGDIETIRLGAKIAREYILKFNPGPTELKHSEFINLKRSVVEAAVRRGARMFVSVIHHGVIRNGDVDRARRNAINMLLLNFNAYLLGNSSHGLVLLDRFSDKALDTHIKDRMSVGLVGLPFSAEYKLKNIVGCHLSAAGQSHFCSIIDVCLGSLRFAINAHASKKKRPLSTSAAIVPLLAPLFAVNERGRAPEIHFTFSPKTVKANAYREKYEELQRFLTATGLPTAQRIVANRNF